ncbi:MAG: DUF2339 domain-containing protein [Pontiellaceae bacterium]|nr:DUF2339 domain-containing protein [Pontiellaceae bacterium]MBN2783371.1 DUF2339 domain-containing protein [Pontiellaceae bacterium]
MEGLIILLVVLFIFAPITLAIIALVKVAQSGRELERLRREIQPLLSRAAIEKTDSPAPICKPEVQAPEPVAESRPVAPPVTVPPPMPSAPIPSKPRPKPRGGVEFMMGGKAAAFAGIAVLVTGIVFLVGYAIQHSWIGPGMRIVLGLLAGGLLVAGGHFVERRDEKLRLFARVLTGGGSALFYFSVFAAYGIYHLIGMITAGAGLFASALAVFGLAMAYRSQAVGVLGVLGAFVTPLLIGCDMDAGVFPLVYVAVINIPVLLLGVHRKWQLLYNLAFVFTIIHFLTWLDWFNDCEVWVGLGFALLYFVEYAALGLLKLRSEQKISGRSADMIRLMLASMLLLGAVYWLLDESGKGSWTGAAFLILALLHAGLARFAFKVLSAFNAEILCFLSGGLIFATLALPAQLDGEWVSLGWAVEGVVLAWFAGRVRSRALQGGAFLLGLIGILKSMTFDFTFYETTPNLFLNARFIVGMISAGLLGAQGWLASRYPEEKTTVWQDLLWCAGVIGAVLVFYIDTFWSLGEDEIFSWLMTSLILLGAGAATILLAPKKSGVIRLGAVLLLLVPLKLALDAVVGNELIRTSEPVFLNIVIWLQLAMLAAMIFYLQPRLPSFSSSEDVPPPALGLTLNLMSLASGIWLMTWEIMRSRSDWAASAITILWAVCALALILFGMKKRMAAHRYFGLALFGLATLKVLIFDSSELKGLERIAAFIGTGVLLLGLSFAYQKASAYFQSLGEEQ